MAVDGETTEKVLDVPTEDQEDLTELGPEVQETMTDFDDAVSEAPSYMSESRKGVLLDDHHYFDDDEYVKQAYEAPKHLPSGTSKYQSAWYLDGETYGSDVEESENENDGEDMNMDEERARPEDGYEGRLGPAATTVAGTVYGDDAKSEMFMDPSPDQELAQIAAFRNRASEVEENREFPDEIELEPGVLARERLARYRGLKSLRNSKWEKTEDIPWQPEDWNRLAQIQNYRGMKTRILNEALVGGVQAGTRVLVYLRNGNPEVVQAFKPERPMVLWGLLRHEHKQGVVNVSISASTDYYGGAVKSKDELILQIGPRRLHVNPLFSTAGGTGSNNVSKFERFLTPGQTSIATFVGPVTWGNVPVVAWKRGDGKTEWELVGSGSFLGVDRERVVAKRVVLTGHPYKIHKRLVTVRYMFFNQGKHHNLPVITTSLLIKKQRISTGSRRYPCSRAAAAADSSRRAWAHTDTSRPRSTGGSTLRTRWPSVCTSGCSPGDRPSLQSRRMGESVRNDDDGIVGLGMGKIDRKSVV